MTLLGVAVIPAHDAVAASGVSIRDVDVSEFPTVRLIVSTQEAVELSDREVEVLRLMAAGCTNPDIGQKLGISRRTAEHHVQHIYAKVGVSSRAGLALFAHEHGLIAEAADA